MHTQSCPTLCDLTDYSLPARLLCSWDSPSKNTGVGCHFLLQEIFQTWGSIPSLLCFPALAASFFTTAPPGKPLTLVRQGGKRISFLQGCPFTPGYLPSGSLGIFTTIWVCHHFSLSFFQTLPWSHLLILHLPRESQLSEHSPCKILNSTLTGQGQQLHLLFRQTVPSSAKNSHVRKRMMHLTCQWEEDKLRKKLDA